MNMRHRLSVVDLLFVVLKKLHMYNVIYMWSIFNKSDYRVGIITGMLSVYCFHRVHRNESRCLPRTCVCLELVFATCACNIHSWNTYNGNIAMHSQLYVATCAYMYLQLINKINLRSLIAWSSCMICK